MTVLKMILLDLHCPPIRLTRPWVWGIVEDRVGGSIGSVVFSRQGGNAISEESM